MSEIFRHRNAHRIVGVSILAIVILAAFTIVSLLHRNEAFSQKDTYFLQSNQTQLRGLHKAMAVRVLGETIGTVTDVSYVNQSSEVRLTMEVKASQVDRKNTVWENSRIIVGRSFGIGQPYLEIERGNDILGAIVSNLLEREAQAVRIQGNGSQAVRGRGVRIRKVVKDSPAEVAGLKIDDIIISFDGVPVDSLSGMYEIMSLVSQGDTVEIGIHGRDGVVKVMTGPVVAQRLKSGGTIIQFQEEENSLEGLAGKLEEVQESISSVETSLVETLTITNQQMESSLVPALQQFLKTNRSIELTSDVLREDTIERANLVLNQATTTLSNIDSSSKKLNESVDKIAGDFDTFLVDRAGPSFDRFGDASDSFKEAAKNMDATVQGVGTDASDAMAQWTVASQRLNDLLAQSQDVVASIEEETKDLPGTIQRVNEAVISTQKAAEGARRVASSTQRVVDGVGEHVLLRRAVKRSDAKKAGKSSSGPIRRFFGL